MELVNSIFQILLTSVIQLFSLIGVIIVIGFLLGYLESLTRMYWSRAFGRKGFLLTAWIGVPIHELGHAIMCVLFRHKIVATQFFPTDTSQGALGYIQHQYNQKKCVSTNWEFLYRHWAYYFWYYCINPFNALFRTRIIFFYFIQLSKKQSLLLLLM